MTLVNITARSCQGLRELVHSREVHTNSSTCTIKGITEGISRCCVLRPGIRAGTVRLRWIWCGGLGMPTSRPRANASLILQVWAWPCWLRSTPQTTAGYLPVDQALQCVLLRTPLVRRHLCPAHFFWVSRNPLTRSVSFFSLLLLLTMVYNVHSQLSLYFLTPQK